MKLSFDEISSQPSMFTVTDSSWFGSDESVVLRSSEARLSLRKQDGETVQLQGEMRGCISTLCSRCGESVEQDLEYDFLYRITSRPEPPAPTEDVECSDEDSQMLYLGGSQIDIGEILREQLYLNLPFTSLCSDECPGICADCGAVVKNGTCVCSTQKTSSPFSVLGKLIDR